MKLNLPNKLIVFRFILAILVFALLIAIPYTQNVSALQNEWYNSGRDSVNILSYIALVLFVLASLTDFADGKLARKNNQITTFGKIFDPLADKILVNGTLIILTWLTRIPVWATVIFIARDLLVDGLRIALSSKGVVIAANNWGKRKTFFQMVGITLLFFLYPNASTPFDYTSLYNLALIPLYIGLAFSVYSGVVYYKDNWGSLN